MTIDSHVHFWQYNKVRDAWITDEMALLQQDLLPRQLVTELAQNDVQGIVAVQADQSEAETMFLTALTANYPVIKGVVGWIDLQNRNIHERLQHFSRFPEIKGWRHIAQAEADDFLSGKQFRQGIAALQPYGYTYDILVYPRQLEAACLLAEEFPEQKFILDHCGKPAIYTGSMQGWQQLVKRIANCPNVYCKLSGLLTEAGPVTPEASLFYPWLDVVFEAFGTDRLLFGSDWPVLLLSGHYRQWKALICAYMSGMDATEQQKILGGNAITFYNL